MSIGHRIEISGARRSASPKKTIRPTLWSSEKEPVAEVQPSAPQKVQLPDSPKEQSPRFKVPEKRSPRKNTGIILGRSPRGMPQQQDAKAIVEPSETAQPASERRDIVRERIRDFEERAKLASKVAVHLANMNRQPPGARAANKQNRRSARNRLVALRRRPTPPKGSNCHPASPKTFPDIVSSGRPALTGRTGRLIDYDQWRHGGHRDAIPSLQMALPGPGG
jgi:hypothetical protein